MRYSNIFLIALVLILAACEKGQESTKPSTGNQDNPATKEMTLAAGCDVCHGANGASSMPGIPFISGQSAGYLERAMYSYIILDRKNEIMRQAILDVDAEKRKELASYFANSNVKWRGDKGTGTAGNRTPDPGAVRAGKAIAGACESCHGSDGNSIKAGIPSLAGLQPEYFIPAIKDYLTGRRQGAAVMKNFKLSLNEDHLKNLAAYFSIQKRQRSPLDQNLLKTTPSNTLVPRCVGCHGDNGNSTHPAIPGLAGQNASYLIKAMKHYRSGERRNKMMTDVAKGLSDEEIESNATYFASQAPATQASAAPLKTTSTTFDPMGDGATLAGSCNGCHGTKGNNPSPGIPRLAGLSYRYLQKAIAEYRDGKRNHQMMQMLTRFLSETDIEKISYFYASQAPITSKSTLKIGNQQAGQKAASGCAGCHGEDGNSQDLKIPSLAGQSADYLVSAIKSYKKNGSRNNGDMQGVAQELDDKSISNLAQYFSQLTPKADPPRPLEGPDVLSEKCNRCHGDDGAHPDPEKPRLAGQRRTYLMNALKAYRSGDRIHSTMQAMAGNMWTVEIGAIASYYAGKQ